MNLTQNQQEWLYTLLSIILIVFCVLVSYFTSNLIFWGFYIGIPICVYLGEKGKWFFFVPIRHETDETDNKVWIILGIVLYLTALPVLFLIYQEPFNNYKTFLQVLLSFLGMFGGSFIITGIGFGRKIKHKDSAKSKRIEMGVNK